MILPWENPEALKADEEALKRLMDHSDISPSTRSFIRSKIAQKIHPLLEENSVLLKDVDSLTLAMECGLNPNIANKEGFTPLFLMLVKSYSAPTIGQVEALIAGGLDLLTTL